MTNSTVKISNVVVVPPNASMLQIADSSDLKETREEKSDTFYYILGIIILIASAILFKQRYEQYLKDKDRIDN